jgi:isopenicillin-N N-acyltransferase-like protein
MNNDCNFPRIKYYSNQSPYDRGFSHGKAYKESIKELVDIRKGLMLEKSPNLEPHLDQLARKQWEISRELANDLAQEIKGIADGAEATITDIVILNNYTDFRDIELPEEGCSTIWKKQGSNLMLGQTWDMHESAKRYVCLIEEYNDQQEITDVYFSLVGCVGMMGVSHNGLFVGVNNINTKNSRAGVIWPLLVRRLLQEPNLDDLRELLNKAEVTGGHNYLIGDEQTGEHWEITPLVKEQVQNQSDNYGFHTNHCLAPGIIEIAYDVAGNSTTHDRYQLLEKKMPNIESLTLLRDLLGDHEGYPKSICSHFESGKQDPSMTCGGGVFSIEENYCSFWRGCKEHDDNYVEYNYKIVESGDKYIYELVK